MEVAILFTLILLNGAFAMSEIALVAARKGRMQKFIDDGDRGAMVALELGKEPTRFLSTVQIGITSISIMNGIVGEAVLAHPLDLWLRSLGADPTWSEYGATGLVVVTITYFSIVLGELVPKRIGQQNPELVARLVSRPIRLLSIATRPFVRLLAGSTDLILTALGAKNRSAPGVTEEEIHAMLSEGSDSGVIEQHEHTMVRNVFRLDDRQLGSLMVPRADIVVLGFTGCLNPNQVVDSLVELRGKLPTVVQLWAGGSAPVLVRRTVPGVLPLGSLQELTAALRHWRERAGSRPPAASPPLA